MTRPLFRSSRGAVRPATLLLLLTVIAAATWLASYTRLAQAVSPAEPRTVTPRGDLPPDEQSTIAMFKSTCDSVVYIEPLESVGVPWSDETRQYPTGTGTGFVWDTAGHVVTNFHVVQGASGALVTLHTGQQFEAKRVLGYPAKDVAVLTIEAPAEVLHPVTVGTSADLQVGQKVYAIGNPYGLDYSLTHGIISALEREMESLAGRTISGVIQTDAAINPGNSGGPLLDSAGRLIGMNTMIYSQSGSSAGLGFAVPVDTIRLVVTQLIANGKVVWPGLGIKTPPSDQMRGPPVEGVPIMQVFPGSAAERAGLTGYTRRNGRLVPGDVILAVDGTRVHDVDGLRNTLERYAIGQTVKLRVQRDGEEREVPVTLQEVQ